MLSTDELIARAEIGDEGRRFLESDLGKTMLGLALQEVQTAQEALEKVSPSDIKKIMDLQQQARMGRKFEEWLTYLIADGEEAMNVWKQQQENQHGR